MLYAGDDNLIQYVLDESFPLTTITYDGQDYGQDEIDFTNDGLEAVKAKMRVAVLQDNIMGLKRSLGRVIQVIKQNCEESRNYHLNYTNSEQALKRILNELDPDGSPILHRAARFNNFEATQLLVENGADVNALDNIGCTPLHYAAWGRKMTAKNLVCKLDQNVSDGKHIDSINLAINEDDLKNEQIINYLIANGANVNIQDRGNQTPLHNAATRGNLVAIHALLTVSNINVNVTDVEQQTPLHIACNFGWTEICELLIKAKAVVNLKDKRKCTPLHYASAEGNCHVIGLLLKSVENDEDRAKFINMKACDCETPLTMAVINEREQAVKLLLEQGCSADISIKCKNLNGILHVASIGGNVNILQILTDHGANIHSKNVDGKTALHVACAMGSINAVQYLLTKGADIEARDNCRSTPLLSCLESAPSNNNYKIIRMLVECGANTDTSDKNDKTTVILAAIMNNVEALEYLLGLDKCKLLVNRVDRNSRSPLHHAALLGNFDAFKCLIKHGSVIDAKNDSEQTPLHLAVLNGHLQIVKYILKHDEGVFSLVEADSSFDTPLHIAAARGYCDIIKVILSYGQSDLEKRNGMYFTSLDCAAANGHKKTVQHLLNHGAKIDGGESYTNSALHEACERGKANVVKLLLNNGASIDRLDSKGRNCLEVAIDFNQKEVAKVIVSHQSWKNVMKHSRTNSKYFPSCRSTPLRELVLTMPDVADMVLTNCITFDGLEKIYDYELIDDVYCNWDSKCMTKSTSIESKNNSKDTRNCFNEKGRLCKDAKLYSSNVEEIRKMHPLMIMVSQQNEALLGHEICVQLLTRKWRSYARSIYYIGLFIYILFTAALTDFAVNSTPYYNFGETFSKLPFDFCYNNTLTTLYMDSIPKVPTRVRVSQYLCLVLSLINIMKELLQLYYRRKNYWKWQNALEVTLYIFALTFVVDWNSCSMTYGYRMHKQWLFGVVAVILTWINFILMVRQFPTLGIYVVMFTDVLHTFAKFFVVFFLFVIAFALGFFMLFQNQVPFTSFLRTIVKTLVMMVGEFEYNTMFYSSMTEHNEKTYYPIASQILFFIFAIIMTILISNLLVGLAVDDIKSVQTKAVLKRLAMRAELILEMEFIAPEFIRKKFMIGHETVLISQPVPLLTRLFRLMFPRSKSESAVDAAVELYGDKETQHKSCIKLSEEFGKLKQAMKQLQSQQDQMQTILSAIAAHLNVNIVNPQPEH